MERASLTNCANFSEKREVVEGVGVVDNDDDDDDDDDDDGATSVM